MNAISKSVHAPFDVDLQVTHALDRCPAVRHDGRQAAAPLRPSLLITATCTRTPFHATAACGVTQESKITTLPQISYLGKTERGGMETVSARLVGEDEEAESSGEVEAGQRAGVTIPPRLPSAPAARPSDEPRGRRSLLASGSQRCVVASV